MKKHLLMGLALSCAVASHAFGKEIHSFMSGPFKNGPEVTKTCLKCHERDAKAFMKTVHWNWSKNQSVDGKSIEYGKKTAQNYFCGALSSDWQSCTSCHAGYGWTDGTFDFSKAEAIDCLVCHETTGTYKRFPSAAGHPVYPGETKEFPAGKVWQPVNLVAVAKSVDWPDRAACGSCHFYGGGADNAKHGDLDSSLVDPTPDMDIHMGGKGMTCISCHRGADHDVKGEGLSVSFRSGARTLSCTDCHKGAVHPKAALNMHMKRVACQTCHIPNFAKVNPTVMSWDWSTAGKDVKPADIKKDASGQYLYDKTKGDLTWEKNAVPSYFWYNGSIERVFMGQKIDASKVVRLSAPIGERKDANAKIYPFKVMKGKLPYDVENGTLAFVNFAGPFDAAKPGQFDWNKAIEAGMKGAGQPYSGKYGWVDASMVWSLNHMVAPKAKALSCPNCHVKGGRIDWKTMGYPMDPR